MRAIRLMQPVGKNCTNRADDVRVVHEVLVSIGKLPRGPSNGAFDEKLLQGILGVQKHFLAQPDGVISVGGRTHRALQTWRDKEIKPGVELPGRLREAWNLVSPLLPDGSNCTSGYRSAEKQRALLHGFFEEQYKRDIIAKYGQSAYDAAAADLLANEQKVLEMVRGVGQLIAAPGRSMHQLGKAIDVGGHKSLDAKQVEVIKRVALANPGLLSGVVKPERNGCVHFEIR